MTTAIPTSQAGRLQLRIERRGAASALVEAAGHVPYAPRAVAGKRPGDRLDEQHA